jgi:hypothetical protein
MAMSAIGDGHKLSGFFSQSIFFFQSLDDDVEVLLVSFNKNEFTKRLSSSTTDLQIGHLIHHL